MTILKCPNFTIFSITTCLKAFCRFSHFFSLVLIWLDSGSAAEMYFFHCRSWCECYILVSEKCSLLGQAAYQDARQTTASSHSYWQHRQRCGAFGSFLSCWEPACVIWMCEKPKVVWRSDVTCWVRFWSGRGQMFPGVKVCGFSTDRHRPTESMISWEQIWAPLSAQVGMSEQLNYVFLPVIFSWSNKIKIFLTPNSERTH